MGQYRPPANDKYASRTSLEVEEPKSALFVIFCIYLPVLLLVIAIRAAMLWNSTPIIHLPLVDTWIGDIVKELQNYYYFST